MNLPFFKSRKEKLKEKREELLEKRNERRKKEPLPPYDQREKIHKLSMLFTIVNRGQANYFTETYASLGAALSMDLFAYSMPPQEILAILGSEETKKDIVLTVVREDDKEKIKEAIKNRFAVSAASKGIAFFCPVDGVGGIAVYKFLADQNRNEETKTMEEEKKETLLPEGEEKTNEEKEKSLVLAIVNKGNTDLVMHAARKAGSRGGTISIARGTGNPELAKTYGIVIQPEKEIVFIVVDKDIKDQVMKQIYDEAGIGKKGMGILLSLPISDAIGLNPIDETPEEEVGDVIEEE